jgi:hypothetical protein
MSYPGFELVQCENTLLCEISDPQMRRLDVAKTYRLAMESSDCAKVSWKRVNEAIIKRWSKSALVWIKNQAWSGKCFGEIHKRRKDNP